MRAVRSEDALPEHRALLLRRGAVDPASIADVNNPTDDEVILDCGALRVRFPAHKAADVLLMPGDKGCDLMNDATYVPIEDVMTISGALTTAPGIPLLGGKAKIEPAQPPP